MLAYCGDWYNRFLDEYGGDFSDAHRLLNQLALEVDPARLWRVECGEGGERYRAGWTRLSLARKVASVQWSIALELLGHVKRILAEIPDASHVERVVLTGGLSQSPFFQQVFLAGIDVLAPGRQAAISGRTGPLRYKTSAYGALLNARLPEWSQDLANMPQDCFPLAECARADERTAAELERLLRAELDRVEG
jgi:hypothetical protein